MATRKAPAATPVRVRFLVLAILVTAMTWSAPTPLFAAEGSAETNAPGTTHVFFDGFKSKFLHIGDDRGNRSDIHGFLIGVSEATGAKLQDLSSYVGSEHRLEFTLPTASESAVIQLKILSLVQKGARVPCSTYLQINGSEDLDLRDGENVGTGKLTTYTATVSTLKKGQNEIRIREDGCSSGGSNDSLLVSGLVRF